MNNFFIKYADICANACEIAVRDEAHAEYQALGFNTCKFLEDTDTDAQAYVMSNKHLCLVVYRATQTARDWQTNKDYDFVDRSFMKVHQGFYEALSSLEQQVFDEINRVSATSLSTRNPQQKLVFTGHSLGGAMATVAAYDYRHWKPTGTITFGAPRVFHKTTAQRLKSDINFKLMRVAYAADGVTRVPLLGQGYRHTGIPVYFKTDGTHISEGPSFWTDLKEFAKDSISEILKWEILTWEDHKMSRYKTLIDPLLK